MDRWIIVGSASHYLNGQIHSSSTKLTYIHRSEYVSTIFTTTTIWHPFNCLLSFHLRFFRSILFFFFNFVHTIFVNSMNSCLFWCWFFFSLFDSLLVFSLALSCPFSFKKGERERSVWFPFSIDLIWFIRFTSGFDIQKDTIYLATLNISSMWNNVQMVEENSRCVCQTMYYLNGAHRLTLLLLPWCIHYPYTPSILFSDFQ